MPKTFSEVDFIPEGVCGICNAAGEVLDLTDLKVCGDCIMVVARARAATRSPPATRKNAKGRGRATRAPDSNDNAGAGAQTTAPTAELWTEREPAKVS